MGDFKINFVQLRVKCPFDVAEIEIVEFREITAH